MQGEWPIKIENCRGTKKGHPVGCPVHLASVKSEDLVELLIQVGKNFCDLLKDAVHARKDRRKKAEQRGADFLSRAGLIGRSVGRVLARGGHSVCRAG